jgi:hypothetical protein
MNGTAPNYLNGELLIGSTTNSGEKLQVTGTAKITGASSFGGNMTLSLNQNAGTYLTITNTTSGTGAISGLRLIGVSNADFQLLKFSPTTTAYKIAASSDAVIFNNTNSGDIAILNDFTSGNIKFAAGGSSTAHMTLTSVGSLGIGATSVNASAITQIDSTTKGFLPPRMTNAQRTAISSPAVGLIVYCTDMVEGLYVYKSTGWTFII